MVRNYKKLSELERQIQEKDLELARYKQLIANVQALINITAWGINKPVASHDEVLRQAKQQEENDEAKENWEKGSERAKELRRLKQRGKEIDQRADNVVDEAIRRNPDLQKGGEKSHVDELKQRQAEGTLKPSEIKKARSKERQAADKALDEYLQNEVEKTDEERKEGEKGDQEYERLNKKDGVATGGKIAGECKNCGEPFEDKAIRGYHPECWEAMEAREKAKEKEK